MLKNKEHLTDEGLEKINKIKNGGFAQTKVGLKFFSCEAGAQATYYFIFCKNNIC